MGSVCFQKKLKQEGRNLQNYYFWVFFVFWLYLEACGMLVPQTEIQPRLPAVEA